MTFDKEEFLSASGPKPDERAREEAERCLVAADDFLGRGDKPTAASALDRAYGLSAFDPNIVRQRKSVLDELAIHEHGLIFRYVPAGSFRMGSVLGDPDERPVHAQRTGAFWITDTPITWAAYCALMGWSPPPAGRPVEGHEIYRANKIRLQYCESLTLVARDWHAHAGGEEMFGEVPRADPKSAPSYDRKPMVAVGWGEGEELAVRLSSDEVLYALPTEVEWEKAARGGLIDRRYSWGDAAPTYEICECDRFTHFRIRDPRELPANGYGLYGTCGGVWEWTSTWYDALAYRHAAAGIEPMFVETEKSRRVLRGGSWTDCADAVTVSFRTARRNPGWRTEERARDTPNEGFRLVRRVSPSGR